MIHLLLLLVCILSVEVFIILNFLSHLDSILKVTKRVTYIIPNNNISDHWKEKVIPTYALRMMKYSLRILLILLLIISLFFIHFYNERSILYADTIFLMMMVPGIDMFRLFIVRILKKKNPFQADKNHIHHLLLNNYNYKKTIILLSIIIYVPLFLIKIELSNVIILLIYLFIYCFLIFNLKYKYVN